MRPPRAFHETSICVGLVGDGLSAAARTYVLTKSFFGRVPDVAVEPGLRMAEPSVV